MVFYKQGGTELHLVKINVTGLKLIQTFCLKTELGRYIREITGMKSLFEQGLFEQVEDRKKEIEKK